MQAIETQLTNSIKLDLLQTGCTFCIRGDQDFSKYYTKADCGAVFIYHSLFDMMQGVVSEGLTPNEIRVTKSIVGVTATVIIPLSDITILHSNIKAA